MAVLSSSQFDDFMNKSFGQIIKYKRVKKPQRGTGLLNISGQKDELLEFGSIQERIQRNAKEIQKVKKYNPKSRLNLRYLEQNTSSKFYIKEEKEENDDYDSSDEQIRVKEKILEKSPEISTKTTLQE